jgi:outer membrane protein assembly factor BamE (lipoprotein component of BamABCDE complex)
MRLFEQALLSLTLIALLAGCASYSGRGLKPGISTETEVREVMGTPATTWETPGGSTWSYPRGPLGVETFLVRFDESGKLVLIEQVLDDAHFDRIKAGMTQDDVLHLIGPSVQIKVTYLLSDDTSWDYRYRDTWSQTALFSVIFDQAGLVKGSFKQREVGNGHNH